MALQKQTLQITGMSCAHCVRAVRSALENLDGVDVDDVDIGSATVRYDDAQTSPEALAEALEEEGYPVAA